MYWPNDEEYTASGIYIYKAWANPLLEYSVNDSEFKDFEIAKLGTRVLNLDKKSNTVICREKQTKDIVLKDLIVNMGDYYVVFHSATVGHNKGNYVYTIKATSVKDIEYSLDNGKTFNTIQAYPLNPEHGTTFTYYPSNNKLNSSQKILSDQIVIRNSITNES